MRDIPDDNLGYPVLITLEDRSSGSGFFIRTEESIFLITAKHVIATLQPNGTWSTKNGVVELLFYPHNPKIIDPSSITLDLRRHMEGGFLSLHKDADVAALRIGDIKKKPGGMGIALVPTIAVKNKGPDSSIVGLPVSYFRKYADVLVANEVFVLGYPNSLGLSQQIEQRRPLLRKGIVAGKNETTRTLILDCPVYFGNSGGLVVQKELVEGLKWRYYAIGIVSEFVPFIESLVSAQYGTTNTNIENSGYSIAVPIDTIEELLKSAAQE